MGVVQPMKKIPKPEAMLFATSGTEHYTACIHKIKEFIEDKTETTARFLGDRTLITHASRPREPRTTGCDAIGRDATPAARPGARPATPEKPHHACWPASMNC